MRVFQLRRELPWLSDLVQNEIIQSYPQLASPAPRQRLYRTLRQIVPLSLYLTVAFFLIGVGLDELWLRLGWPVAAHGLNVEETGAILASALEYMAALVGIVIPLILLVIEFLGRDASSVIDVYLDRVGIKQTAILALGVLGFQIIALWLVRANVLVQSKARFYLVYGLILLNLGVLWETGRAIWQVKRSISREFFIEALLSKLRVEVKESQREEVSHRLSRLAQVNLCKSLGFGRALAINPPGGTIAVSAMRSGVIQDMHLTRLVKFEEGIETQMTSVSATKGSWVHLIGEYVSTGEPIVYVPGGASTHIAQLQRDLDHCLVIGEPSKKGSDVGRFLNQIKQMAQDAIKEQNDILFEQLMGVYEYLFELGIGLPVPPSVELLPPLFRGWNVTATAIFHLRDIVEAAATSTSHRFVLSFAYMLSRVAKKMIRQSVVSIDESLNDILGLYVTLYCTSRNHNNEHGIAPSFSHLTDDLIDHAWIPTVREHMQDPAVLENLEKVLRLVLWTLSNLLQKMIEKRDVENVQNLLQRMRVGELLAGFRQVAWILEQIRQFPEVDHTHEDEDKEEDEARRQQAAAIAERIPAETAEFFHALTFIAASYVVEGYARDEVDISYFKAILQVIYPHLAPFSEFPRMLCKLSRDPLLMSWYSFHRHPQTKLAFAADDSGKLWLFYCIRGIALLAQHEMPNQLPAVDLQHFLPQLERTCTGISDSAEKWAEVLDMTTDQIQHTVTNFVALNDEIAERWKHEHDRQIIEANLVPEKIASFVQSVNEALKENSPLRELLQQCGRVQECKELPGSKLWGTFECIPRKEYFTKLHDSIEPVKTLAWERTLPLARTEENQLVAGWTQAARSVRTRKDWQTLGPYFDRALTQFDQTGHKASLILVPDNLKDYVFARTTGFMNRYDVHSPDVSPALQRLNLRGFYKNCPVIEWHSTEPPPSILVIDYDRACEVKVTSPQVEVRLPTEAERRRILEQDDNVTEQQLLLSVAVKVAGKIRVTRLEKNAVLKLWLKLPPGAYWSS